MQHILFADESLSEGVRVPAVRADNSTVCQN